MPHYSVEILRGFFSVASFTAVSTLYILTVSAGFSEMILLRIYLNCCKFIIEANFNIFPLSSYTLSPAVLLLLETLIEPFFHNTSSVLTSYFLEPVRFPENFVPSKWTLILERAKCNWGKKSSELGGLPFQHQIFFAVNLVKWSIVMGEKVFGQEFTPCSMHRFK